MSWIAMIYYNYLEVTCPYNSCSRLWNEIIIYVMLNTNTIVGVNKSNDELVIGTIVALNQQWA